MKSWLVLCLFILGTLAFPNYNKCFQVAKMTHSNFMHALNNNNLEAIIDDVERTFQSVPSVFDVCGVSQASDAMRSELPPACTKALAKEAKLLVKILSLLAEDRVKNEKQIMFYWTMFETMYKTQVQKKCPFLQKQQMFQVKNKGDCAEGLYQLSLTFQALDIDLMKGSFNLSLTDMGKIIKKLPDTLDSCNQHAIANSIRLDFPDECLSALGGFVRALATLEHNYSHLEWLRKHMKDVTSTFIRAKVACPIFSR